MTISGGRTKQLDIFCRVTGFTSDFLSFIVVELIRFLHGAIHITQRESATLTEHNTQPFTLNHAFKSTT